MHHALKALLARRLRYATTLQDNPARAMQVPVANMPLRAELALSLSG
jgi:hypothetical protein